MKVRCGFEWHVQLDTSKLFCGCDSKISDKIDYTIERVLRASAGESGVKDVSASFEEERHRKVFYLGSRDSSCLVEADEEPPHKLNEEALQIAVNIATALKMKIFENIIFMRKTIVDGSNTSGFQRTALLGMDGEFRDKKKNIKIKTLMLEEDSARKEKEDQNSISYKLDRLGVPLVEISTDVIDTDENEAKEIALEFGTFTRLFKVKRGIGTIRQDINLSVEGGSRVELKGFQNLRQMEKVILNEGQRQQNLLKIIKEKGHLKSLLNENQITEISGFLKGTESRIIKEAIANKNKILAVKLPEMKGLLGSLIQMNKTFGAEISDYLKIRNGAGIIHSDELPGYGISETEKLSVERVLGCETRDAFMFSIVKDEESGKEVVKNAICRLKELLTEVPSEVRVVNDDGTNSFLRPIGGEARLYVETDLPLIRINKQIFEKAKIYKDISIEKLGKEYGMDEETVNLLIKENKLNLAIKLREDLKVSPKDIIKVMINDAKYIKNKFGVEINDETLIYLLKKISRNEISRDSSRFILEALASGDCKAVDECISKHKLQRVPEGTLRKEVKNIETSLKTKDPVKIITSLREKFGFSFDASDVVKILKEDDTK